MHGFYIDFSVAFSSYIIDRIKTLLKSRPRQLWLGGWLFSGAVAGHTGKCRLMKVYGTWPRRDEDASGVHASNLLHSLLIVLEDHMLTAQVPKVL